MEKDHLFDINVCAVFNGEIHFHEAADVGLWGGAAIPMMDSGQNSPLLTSSLWHFHPLHKHRRCGKKGALWHIGVFGFVTAVIYWFVKAQPLELSSAKRLQECSKQVY